jgi:23S rRNA-/tRNA-specific pseudouridylate synthase
MTSTFLSPLVPAGHRFAGLLRRMDHSGEFAVIHKPAGLPVHARGMTIDSLELRLAALLEAMPAPRRAMGIHFVNRLDRDTSGLMVCALTHGAAGLLGESLRRGEWHKTYRLVVDHPPCVAEAGVGVVGCCRFRGEVQGGLVSSEGAQLQSGRLVSWMDRCAIHGSRGVKRPQVDSLDDRDGDADGVDDPTAPVRVLTAAGKLRARQRALLQRKRLGGVDGEAGDSVTAGCPCRSWGRHSAGYLEHPFQPESLCFESLPAGVSSAKQAILDFRLVRASQRRSIYEATLVTGRTHQIRVQFADSGFPLTGDVVYNPMVVKRLWEEKTTDAGAQKTSLQAWADGEGDWPGLELFQIPSDIEPMALQAFKLSFPHPFFPKDRIEEELEQPPGWEKMMM